MVTLPGKAVFHVDELVQMRFGTSSSSQGARAYRSELKRLNGVDLQKLYASERAKLEEPTQPFNQPDAAADIDHWSKASYWTLDEATALSLGRDPRRVIPTAR